MDPLRALKLIGKDKAFDEAAVRQGLDRKGAYQLDAFPQFDEAMGEVKEGGPIADAMFADMIRYYTEGNTPAPVSASRKPEPVEFLRDRMARVKEASPIIVIDDAVEMIPEKVVGHPNSPYDSRLFNENFDEYMFDDPGNPYQNQRMQANIVEFLKDHPNFPNQPKESYGSRANKENLIKQLNQLKQNEDEGFLPYRMQSAQRTRANLEPVKSDYLGPEGEKAYEMFEITEGRKMGDSPETTAAKMKSFYERYPKEIKQATPRDRTDDFIILAALGSMLGGAGVKEAADYKTDEERLEEGREKGYIT